MKIRTRLLLFLLPTLVGSITLVSALLAYNWYQVTHAIQSASEEQRTSGYTPLYDEGGRWMGFIGADMKVDLIEERFHQSLFLIVLTAGLTIVGMVATLFIAANKISQPIQKLNNSALAIAAGQYGESIQVSGPDEIVQLANTLNTMSECLLENINRLKENSLVRERMYGEYECAMLLQHLMLQKNIDDCRSDAVAIKAITFFSDNPKGLLLDFPRSEHKDRFLIHLAEAAEEGFEGMYQLVARYKYSKESQAHTSLILHKDQKTLQYKGGNVPFLWSLEKRLFHPPSEEPVPIAIGDFFFLFNQGLIEFYKDKKKIEELLHKVLKVFAQEGLATTCSMLQKEISFAIKRKELLEDIHLLCFQILN